jgi:putative glutamine amidotransferase
MKHSIRIAVTDTMGPDHKFLRYVTWLKRGGEGVDCARLSYTIDNLAMIDHCDALVLTGGHDVAPAAYGGRADHPAITEVDSRRDDFERGAIDRAMKSKLPVLGICRGLQIANVHFGGTLLPDIEEAGYRSHRGEPNGERRHGVLLEKDSLIGAIGRSATGNVNTSHHQAAYGVGSGLIVSARSDDGIIEALEWRENPAAPFFLLVQWHPERMQDFENPLSSGILEHFLSSMKKTTKTNSERIEHGS